MSTSNNITTNKENKSAYKKDKNRKTRNEEKSKDFENKKKNKKASNTINTNTTKPKLKYYRIIIRKLPSNNYIEDDFKNCLETSCSLLNLDINHFTIEHFLTGI